MEFVDIPHLPPEGGGRRITPIPEDPDQRRALETEIQALLDKGAVVRTTGREGLLFRSSFFLTPQKKEVLEADSEPAAIKQSVYKTKTLQDGNTVHHRTIPHERDVGMNGGSERRLLTIPIHPKHQRFLAFGYGGTDFKFTALPFGLSTAPRVFTRVAGAAVKELRRRGIPLFVYLDDWLILGDSYQDARRNVTLTTDLLFRLGWLVNEGKSNLTPSQHVKYLGAYLDFAEGSIRPSQERISQLAQLAQRHAQQAILDENLSAAPRTHSQPRGHHPLLQASDEASPDPLTEPLQTGGLRHTNASTSSPLDTRHLAWSANPENWANGRPFHQERPLTSITSDASVGWGAFWQTLTVAGTWSDHYKRLHMNELELEA
ncbi:uncharacterized protein [Apostichopus japonicus]|uniref:uncharacterized protein n=1 Tax=Stichopus japonicus TaxID=307972 RepID=UPI003AB9169D